MLNESDAAIAQRDPALPGLATLLDPVAFGVVLRRALPGLVLGPAKLVYVKPATNYLVGYELTVNGEPLDIYAKTYPQASAAGELAKARERPGITGPLGPGRLALDEIATVVSVYPNDNKVKALSLLADDTSRVEVLRELLPHHPELWQGTLHHLRYKPERRAVLRLDSGGEPQAVLKLFTAHGYETARQASQPFTSRGALRLAPNIGHSDRHQILAFGWLPGRLLSKAMRDPSFPAGRLKPVGAALAELHAQDAGGLPRQTDADVATALLAVADTLGELVPAIALRAHALAQRLAARMAATARCDRPVHGGFHARQVLLDDNNTAAIIDFDHARQGDPADDLGKFIAHLECKVIRGQLTAEQLGALKEGLLEGYAGTSGRPIAAHLDVHVSAVLLWLAVKFFRHRAPDWPQRIEAAVARAEALLAGAP
jgi:Phosphotransferase enzyme family